MKIKAKNKVLYAGLVLILATLACGLPAQATETPTVDVTEIPHSTEIIPTEIETDTAATGEAPDLPLPIVYQLGAGLKILDPADGSEMMQLSAPDLGFGANGTVSAQGVFYVDGDYAHAYRVGFDGAVQALDFLNADGDYFEGLILPSPDGMRVAEGAVLNYASGGSEDSLRVQLKAVNIDGSDEQLLVNQTHDLPLRPTPLKWSADGARLYYTNVIEGIEGFGGLDLYRVDLETGDSEMIFPAASGLVSTSVSPNETYAARAVSGEPLAILIRDLTTDTDQTITLPAVYKQVWQMVWAPDDSALLVTLGQGMWETDAYSVIKIDMASLEVSYLVTDDPSLMRAVAWQVPETIWFNDREGTLWRMDSADLTLTMVAADAWALAISR